MGIIAVTRARSTAPTSQQVLSVVSVSVIGVGSGVVIVIVIVGV